MLLEDTVYDTSNGYAPCEITRQYSVGPKSLNELRDIIREHGFKEDKWDGATTQLFTLLGMCLVRCQEIENYISSSFLLGISKIQKRKFYTINDLRNGWKKKTLGNMLKCIEEAWEIEPMIKANFQLFLKMRNQLIHGLTTEDRYDIHTSWGQKEIVSFLALFQACSYMVRKAFEATLYASIQFAMLHWNEDKKIPQDLLEPEHIEQISLFIEFFRPKEDCI